MALVNILTINLSSFSTNSILQQTAWDQPVTDEMQGWGMTSEALRFEWSLKFFHSLDYYLNFEAGLDAMSELVRKFIIKIINFCPCFVVTWSEGQFHSSDGGKIVLVKNWTNIRDIYWHFSVCLCWSGSGIIFLIICLHWVKMVGHMDWQFCMTNFHVDTFSIFYQHISKLGSCSAYACVRPQWRNQHTQRQC